MCEVKIHGGSWWEGVFNEYKGLEGQVGVSVCLRSVSDCEVFGVRILSSSKRVRSCVRTSLSASALRTSEVRGWCVWGWCV